MTGQKKNQSLLFEIIRNLAFLSKFGQFSLLSVWRKSRLFKCVVIRSGLTGREVLKDYFSGTNLRKTSVVQILK